MNNQCQIDQYVMGMAAVSVWQTETEIQRMGLQPRASEIFWYFLTNGTSVLTVTGLFPCALSKFEPSSRIGFVSSMFGCQTEMTAALVVNPRCFCRFRVLQSVQSQRRYWVNHSLLVQLKPGWWFGTWLDYDFPYVGNRNPNWRTPSFFRGVGQPPTWNSFHSFPVKQALHCLKASRFTAPQEARVLDHLAGGLQTYRRGNATTSSFFINESMSNIDHQWWSSMKQFLFEVMSTIHIYI